MGDEFNPFLEERRRPFWEMAGAALRKVNQDFLEDPRVDALMLPLFDGVTQLKWKEGFLAKDNGAIDDNGKAHMYAEDVKVKWRTLSDIIVVWIYRITFRSVPQAIPLWASRFDRLSSGLSDCSILNAARS
ncbi:MAG: hypothetical protein LQ348_001885 [Seirophora lacunosa]|nr:MAG: hypothetical protein LQ348_001885 [Seirophora lacunosa]